MIPNCIFFNEIKSKGTIHALQLLEETRCRWSHGWMHMSQWDKCHRHANLKIGVIFRLCLATYQQPLQAEPQTWPISLTVREATWKRLMETPGGAHSPPKSSATRQTLSVKVPSAPCANPGDTTHTPNSPVRAPPRLPLLSCLPSSLNCLLNLGDFPRPEDTSGLLDFRKGIGGGDNMWSSCKETEKKIHTYTV